VFEVFHPVFNYQHSLRIRIVHIHKQIVDELFLLLREDDDAFVVSASRDVVGIVDVFDIDGRSICFRIDRPLLIIL